MTVQWLPYLFFFIALFYSSVGFGGGSSYLAILSLFLIEFHEIRSTALILNICVVSIGTATFIKNKVFALKKFWPFLTSSIPLAYFGATMKLSQKAFFLTLGGALILSGATLILRYLHSNFESKEFGLAQKLGLGGTIGLLSGISGIGGGIFLSPVLNLFNWANARTIAALASFFILVNSISGLIGLSTARTFQIDLKLTSKLIVAVILGGMLGSYLSNKKLNLKALGIMTAILVTYVGLRLVLLHGFQVKI